MTFDDSFTFRKSPLEDQRKDEVYLIFDNQQHGPYSVVMVSILRDEGKIPKDTLYWRAGMSGARPLADLAGEIEVTMPRKHHYEFAYRSVPMLIFGSPKSRDALRHSNIKDQLFHLWAVVGTVVAPTDTDPPTGLDGDLLPFTPDADLVMITMPTPRRNTEAYFLAAILPRLETATQAIRYFVLSQSNANEDHGPAEGCIREITADGKNFRAKDFVEPFRGDFIAAIQELYKNEPAGWSCVQPTT